jgi:hypothetical protein
MSIFFSSDNFGGEIRKLLLSFFIGITKCSSIWKMFNIFGARIKLSSLVCVSQEINKTNVCSTTRV